MKAVVVHQYGGPQVLKFEEFPDPVAGPGEVLVRVVDRQGQAGRSVCIGSRGTTKCRTIPNREGGTGVRDT
jgi:hypothetical protein